jgi:hypothetical protein
VERLWQVNQMNIGLSLRVRLSKGNMRKRHNGSKLPDSQAAGLLFENFGTRSDYFVENKKLVTLLLGSVPMYRLCSTMRLSETRRD